VATAHRVNVNFSSTAYRTLEELAESKGKSMSEVLRDAVQLEKWITDTYAEGGRVLLVKDDGSEREILVR
jgi:metal-responsive CopG/Arc/MetJ family transcriptional regulator